LASIIFKSELFVTIQVVVTKQSQNRNNGCADMKALYLLKNEYDNGKIPLRWRICA